MKENGRMFLPSQPRLDILWHGIALYSLLWQVNLLAGEPFFDKHQDYPVNVTVIKRDLPISNDHCGKWIYHIMILVPHQFKWKSASLLLLSCWCFSWMRERLHELGSGVRMILIIIMTLIVSVLGRGVNFIFWPHLGFLRRKANIITCTNIA